MSDATRALDVDGLREGFAGTVLVPGGDRYDEARTLFNTMIDKRPAVIAQCATVEDVRSVLAFGRENGLEIGVRGGGHSAAGAGLSDGGIVLDCAA